MRISNTTGKCTPVKPGGGFLALKKLTSGGRPWAAAGHHHEAAIGGVAGADVELVTELRGDAGGGILRGYNIRCRILSCGVADILEYTPSGEDQPL